MKTLNTQFDKRRRGSALILVIVVTVLLAVIGVMFLMVSRVAEMETAVVATNKDLDAAVGTVVARINDVLVEDLFGQSRLVNNVPFQLQDEMLDAEESFAVYGVDQLRIHSDEPYDYPSHHVLGPGPDGIAGNADDDPWGLGADGLYGTDDDIWLFGLNDDTWLASLEPSVGVDGFGVPVYYWDHITDLYKNNFGVPFYPAYYDPQNALIPANSSEWDGTKPELIVDAKGTLVKVIPERDRLYVIEEGETDWSYDLTGARADADGDGVADSRWVQIPNVTTSRGKPVFAAIRIIDNCAMLNLNAAQCYYTEPYDITNPEFKDASGNPLSPFEKPWFKNIDEFADFDTEINSNNFDAAKAFLYHRNDQSGSGRYLTEINYLPFLRGSDLGTGFFGAGNGDGWYGLMDAKGWFDNTNTLAYDPVINHIALMNVEGPGSTYSFFDISDELEIRNRYLLTSPAKMAFEHADVAYFTLDSAAGNYAALQVPRDLSGNTIDIWNLRIDPVYFNAWDMLGNYISKSTPDLRYRYDRRHVCTFYSFDRIINKGVYPLLTYDFDQLVLSAGWTPSEIEDAENIFVPKGAAATDLSSGVLNGTTGRWELNYNNIETRRKIVHLLFALRAYYLLQIDPNYETVDFSTLTAVQQADIRDAALKAAQVVANIIDYSDDDAPNSQVSGETEGPFYDTLYGEQANVDCTFITEQIIAAMITELSEDVFGAGNGIVMSFGLAADDLVFGYERQPFISEVAADWNGSPADGVSYVEAFGVELVNPYSDLVDIRDWQIKIGSDAANTLSSFTSAQTDDQWQVPAATGPDALGYAVLHMSQIAAGSITYAPGGVIITEPVTDFDSVYSKWNANQSLEIQLLRPAPQWVSDNLSIDFIVVDKISSSDVRSMLGTDGVFSLQREHEDWGFVCDKYAPVAAIAALPYTLGEKNTETVSGGTGFQIAVADDGLPLSRLHELEVLSLFGNGQGGDPNSTLSSQIADPNITEHHFDFDPASAYTTSDVFDYITTINRPEQGTLPGRININTAPVHVIAAAIPPVLADPNAADPAKTILASSLDMAQDIVDYRVANGPYKQLSDLLNVPGFKQYTTTGAWETENVGTQSIEDDIEEAHWVLSNLANKFTVRSDVFTAYILVRLGEDGPQRRMIAIFDRSNVWNTDDRPKLVALHPVPDPR